MIQNKEGGKVNTSKGFNTGIYERNQNIEKSNCEFGSLINKLFTSEEERKQQQHEHRRSQVQSGISKLPFKFKSHIPMNVVSVNIVKNPSNSLDISNILSSMVVPKHFNVSQIVPSNPLCPCTAPCPWGSKWEKWSRPPSDSSLYNSLKKTPMSVNMLSQIQKDMKRTQPLNKGYRSFANRKLLQEVLQIYSKYDKQLEYIQGMNMITSVILYHVHRAQPTFWILVDIMERNQFRQIYVNKFENLPKHTKAVNDLISQTLPNLWNHLLKLEIEFEWISTGWLLSLLCNLIPLEFAHLVIDRFIKDGWKSLYEIIVTYLASQEERLVVKNDHSDLLSYFSPSVRDESVDWHQIIVESANIQGWRKTKK